MTFFSSAFLAPKAFFSQSFCNFWYSHVFTYVNSAPSCRRMYGLPGATVSIYGFQNLEVSLHHDGVLLFLNKCCDIASPLLKTTLKTRTLAGNFVLTTTGTSSRSWTSKCSFHRFTVATIVRIFSCEKISCRGDPRLCASMNKEANV